MAVPAAAMAARAAAAVAAEWWQEDDEVLLAELHASLEAGRHTAACKSYAVQRAPPRTRRGWYVGARRCETAGPHARMATAVQPRQIVPQALLLLCCSCGGGGGGGKRDEVSSYTGMAAGSAVSLHLSVQAGTTQRRAVDTDSHAIVEQEQEHQSNPVALEILLRGLLVNARAALGLG